MPAMRKSMSKTSLKSSDSSTTVTVPTTSASAPADLNLPASDSASTKSESSLFSPMPTMYEAAASLAFIERTPFAIDDARDEDEESDEDDVALDDDVMDEVRVRCVVSIVRSV